MISRLLLEASKKDLEYSSQILHRYPKSEQNFQNQALSNGEYKKLYANKKIKDIIIYNHFIDGKIAASVYVWRSPLDPKRGMLEAYVDKDFQGQGISKLALKKLFKMCKAKGVTIIDSGTSNKNKASHGMHNAMGFKEIPGGEKYNEHLYIKYL